MTVPAPRGSPGKPRREVSLRAQLTFWFLTISLVIHITLIAVLLLYQHLRMGETTDRRLRAFAETAATFVQVAERAVTDDDLLALRDRSRVFPAEVPRALAVFDPSGALIASSLRPPPSAAEAGLARVFISEKPAVTAEHLERLRDQAGSDESQTIVISTRTADGSTRLVWAAANDPGASPHIPPQILAAVLSAEVVAITIAGWMIAGLAIRPFTQLRRVAASLSPEALEDEVRVTARSTEIRVLERDLQDTRVKLRSALHAQDRFVSNVSHELKTPIAILLTEAQTLPPGSVTGEGRKFVASVVEEMRRLGRMTESFLILTRVRGGGSLPNPRPYNVNEFVLEAIGDCQHQSRASQVEIAAQFAEEGGPLTVTGDPELLRVMMHNLIRNSVRFSASGGRVVVKVSNGHGQAQVSVRDFGAPIPGEMLERVFTHAPQSSAGLAASGGFARGSDGPADGGEKPRGHGLGLAIAQGIAELHGGNIEVSNAPGAGCEFVVRLPLSFSKPSEAGPDMPGNAREGSTGGDTQSMTRP